MKCKVCGADSGKYPLCRVCNVKKENGSIIKCPRCGNWHSATGPCSTFGGFSNDDFVYDAKRLLISRSEQEYFAVILASLPADYHVFPQVNLASFIAKNDDSPFHNELFRNVDFLVTNENYKPLFVIEINDQTHLNQERRERDEKVQKICEEAGIPLVKFWTSYGVNPDYIKKKIEETITSLPVERIHHFSRDASPESSNHPHIDTTRVTPGLSLGGRGGSRHSRGRRGGCYVATCVYGSYDCPEVWTLRRFRDEKLASTWYGRLFIKIYYALSPIAVKLFGGFKWFHSMFKPMLDKLVSKLSSQGVECTPYEDRDWS